MKIRKVNKIVKIYIKIEYMYLIIGPFGARDYVQWVVDFNKHNQYMYNNSTTRSLQI